LAAVDAASDIESIKHREIGTPQVPGVAHFHHERLIRLAQHDGTSIIRTANKDGLPQSIPLLCPQPLYFLLCRFQPLCQRLARGSFHAHGFTSGAGASTAVASTNRARRRSHSAFAASTVGNLS